MSHLGKTLAVLALSLVFTGCGQKGPLTLPQTNDAPAEQEETTYEPV